MAKAAIGCLGLRRGYHRRCLSSVDLGSTACQQSKSAVHTAKRRCRSTVRCWAGMRSVRNAVAPYWSGLLCRRPRVLRRPCLRPASRPVGRPRFRLRHRFPAVCRWADLRPFSLPLRRRRRQVRLQPDFRPTAFRRVPPRRRRVQPRLRRWRAVSGPSPCLRFLPDRLCHPWRVDCLRSPRPLLRGRRPSRP